MSRGVLAQLRDLVPPRPLSREESLQLAEQQARVFLELSGVTEAPVPEWIITDLPNVTATVSDKLPTSGATQMIGGVWRIVLRASEPATRHRFSMAHESKHIIDDLFEKTYFSKETNIAERHRWVEGVCDYFAGCLLVPRPMLKKVWTNGTQDIDDLAEHFDVSRAAIVTRLSQTGLTTSTSSTKPKAAGCAKKRPWGRYQRSLQGTEVAA